MENAELLFNGDENMPNVVKNYKNVENGDNVESKVEYSKILVESATLNKINILKAYYVDSGLSEKEKVNMLVSDALNLLYREKKADLDSLFE